jgi:hypothetical protein
VSVLARPKQAQQMHVVVTLQVSLTNYHTIITFITGLKYNTATTDIENVLAHLKNAYQLCKQLELITFTFKQLSHTSHYT